MKSFFKKLAFVMALAMVVSLAAPAAAKADTVVSLADQYTGTVYEEVDLTLEEVIDFKFVNPPEGWDASGVQRAWVSSNPEVATVNGWGKVFPVALGTTEISWTIDGTAVATCTVNVIEEVEVEEPVATPTNTAAPTPTNTTAPSPTPTEAPLSFEVVQVSDSKLEVRFNKASTYAENDVNFLITYDNPYGEKPIEFKWNLKEKKYNADKTVLTLTANSLFRDGATYAVQTADGELRDDVEIEIGKVTSVGLVPRKNAAGEEIFIVNPMIDEDTAIDYKLYFDVKLYSNDGDRDIDVTDTYWDCVEADFLLESASGVAEDVDAVDVNTDNLEAKREIEIVFEAENVLVYITPSFVIDTGEEGTEPYTVGGPKLPMGSGSHTPWNIVGVSDWAIVPSTQDAKKPVDWTKKTLTADDTEGTTKYYIVLKLIDINEQPYVTYEKAVEDGANKYTIDVEYFADAYDITFHVAETSANDVLINPDGEIKVYKQTTATFYVTSFDNRDENAEDEYIWAADIEVKAGKELKNIDIKESSLTVLTETNVGETNTAKAEITAVSQYPGVGLTLNGSDFTYTVTPTTDITLPEGAVTVQEIGGKVYVVADGEKLSTLSVSSFKVTVKATEKDTNKNASDTVEIKIVKTTDDKGDFVYDVAKRNNYAPIETAFIKANEVKVKASDATTGVVTGTASVYMVPQGASTTPVDYYNLEEAEIAENDKWAEAITVEGTTYVIVKDPSGRIVGSDRVEIVDGYKVVVDLTSETDGELEILATGKYTVQVGVVRYYKQNPNKSRGDYKSATVSFEVKDGFDKVTLKGTKNDATYDYAGEIEDFDTEDDATVKDLIVKTLAFKLGNNDWNDLTAEMIEDYSVVALGDKVIVKSVTFHVPGATGYYYVKEVRPIDKAITLE